MKATAMIVMMAAREVLAFTPNIPRIPSRLTSPKYTAFIPTQVTVNNPKTYMNMLPMELNTLFESAATASSTIPDLGSQLMLSFADQGQNLAGIFFQASLLPYIIFLYFIGFRGNRTPNLGNFGFQFLLLFVLSTIPSGIISKLNYGTSLANVDWLHGGAEMLLTVTNLLIVFGFRKASSDTETDENQNNQLKIISLGLFATFAAFCFGGAGLGFGEHSAFLFGLGNLPTSMVQSFEWVQHTEPANALSIPTWAIHSSSVFEWIFAMSIIWNYAKVTENETWKGLTWGMLPLHASGCAACTYHFFYNDPSLQYLVATQAGLTLLGNLTLAIAAFRIAKSNGWNLSELNPFSKLDKTNPKGIVADNIAALPLKTTASSESELVLAGKLAALTFGTAYLVKYGELALDLPFEANPFIALLMVLTPPAFLGYTYYNLSQSTSESGEGLKFSIPGFGGGGDGENQGLSMADVKKYGVAGTVAYILTELAFWAVAFPVASTALYQSTGHWPDVINDSTDRTTVLGFIFAGANIARLLVPLRLGAALALAPWVDENIINRSANPSRND